MMSAENVQRQHLEELRKERSLLSQTTVSHAINPDKKRRTARKSTHSGRTNTNDVDATLGKDDENSTASDTSRDSRTSELEVQKVSESVFGKPTEKLIISKKLGGSEDSTATALTVPKNTDGIQTMANPKCTKKSDPSNRPSTHAVEILDDDDIDICIKKDIPKEIVDVVENVSDEKSSKEIPETKTEKKVITDDSSLSLSKDEIFDKLKDDIPLVAISESDSLSKDAIFDKLKDGITLEAISESDSLSKDTIFDKLKCAGALEEISESDSLSKDAIFDNLKDSIALETTSESESLSKDVIFDKVKQDIPLETTSKSKMSLKDDHETLDSIFDKLRGDVNVPLKTTSENSVAEKTVQKDDHETLDSIFNKLRGDVDVGLPLETSSDGEIANKTVSKGSHETSDSIFDKLKADVPLTTTLDDVATSKIPIVQKDKVERSDSIFDKLRVDVPLKAILEDVETDSMDQKDDDEPLDSILDKFDEDSWSEASRESKNSKSVPKDTLSEKLLQDAFFDKLRKDAMSEKGPPSVNKKAVEDVSRKIFDDDINADKSPVVEDVSKENLDDDAIVDKNLVLEDVSNENSDEEVMEDKRLVLEEVSNENSDEDVIDDKSPVVEDQCKENSGEEVIADKSANLEDVSKENSDEEVSKENSDEEVSADKSPEEEVSKENLDKEVISDKSEVLEGVSKANSDKDVIADKRPSSANKEDTKAVSVSLKNSDKKSNSEIVSTETPLTGEGGTPEKEAAAPEDMKKVWENIRKDLTLTGDAEDPDEKEDFNVMEELPFGESLPQTEEEPSDWEEYEENSDHEEQEEPEELEKELPAVGECVVISSDDDHSRESQAGATAKSKKTETLAVESKKDETSKVEKTVPVSASKTVKEDDETVPEENIRCKEKVPVVLSEVSDTEDPPSKKSKMEEADDSEKEEDKLEVSLEIVEPEMPELEKIVERTESPEVRLEMECVPEEVKPAADEKMCEDDPAVIGEKKGGKRVADDFNASGDTDDKSDVKKLKLEADVKDEDKIEEKPSTTILSKKILEELISRKIKDFMTDGNKSAFSALKERCDSLEKSVERWKFRAQHLQNQLNELVLEQKRYNARKVKVPTRTVGINVRMVQQVVSTTPSTMKPPALTASPVSTAKSSDKTPTTRAGPVPLQLIANMASNSPAKSTSVLAPSTQTSAKPASVTSTPASVKIIDLTLDEEHAAAQKTVAALPSGTTIVRPPVTIQPGPTSLVNVPVVQGGVSSVMQLIPTSTTSLTTGARLTSPTTMAPGARVTYLVPNTLGAPRQLMAFPQQNILQGARQPMQTILLRMNTVPQSGATTAQFVTSTATNSTISLVTSPAPPTPIRAPIPTQTFIRASTPLTSTTTTTTQAATPLSTLVISCLQKHPAPLPVSVTYPEDPKLKSLPPRPALKISKVANGIVLSWNMTVNAIHADISVYQLYAYQETNGPPSTSLWKKVGDVRALPLPMACTLTQFVQGHKYHFAVRAVDAHNRLGPFSEPTSIVLNVK